MRMSERTVTEIPATKTQNKAKEKGSVLRVAACCRVSTDSEEQLSSYQSQIEYYSTLIEENPKWKLAGIFADEGLSGTSTKKREEFNKMIRKCRLGRIDMVITKSVSRFARNSLDCLYYIRKLNEWGVDVFFEKEGLHTSEQPDETLLTIMGIMAQNESMSLSRNVRLGYQHGFNFLSIMLAIIILPLLTGICGTKYRRKYLAEPANGSDHPRMPTAVRLSSVASML